MKKRCLALLVALFCTGSGIGQAVPALYPIGQLPAHTSPTWTQTYQAHGREIVVDEVIQIPQVDKAPVLRVTPMAPLPQEVAAAWEAQMAHEDGTFLEKPGFRVYYAWHNPSIFEGRQYHPGRMTQDRRALFDADPAQAYADNNPLTLSQAHQIAQDAVHRMFPEMSLHLRNAAVYDRVYDRQQQKKLAEKGYYWLEYTQSFFGIPYLASVYNTFEQTGLHDEWMWAEEIGVLQANVWDADAYTVNLPLFALKQAEYEDVPLLPFDAVKGQVEELIASGHIRWVDSVALGYVQYATETPQEFLLVPCWVVWCQYVKDGPEAEPTGPIYADSLFHHNDTYLPIILNAQTGQRVEPTATEPGRDRCPPILGVPCVQ